MTTVTIPLTAVSVQSPKATTRYGAVAVAPLSASGPAAQLLVRAALNGIPSNAVVSSALLQLWQHKGGTGSVALTAQANTAAFSTRTTYSTKPATSATNQATQTLTAPAAGAQWSLDVTAMAQSWVSGTLANNGVTISTTSTTAGSVKGQAAASLKPQLVVTYNVPAEPPTGLHPTGGAVSVAKPTLTFQAPSDTLSVQVQVDPAANATTPAFDSGELAASAGLVSLATTAYAGLADGASTQWRARVKNALGWSAWSGWVSFSRAAWKALTIVSPAATSEDPSPVIQATYAGTTTSWLALTRDASGKTVETSNWTPGATISFGTTKSVGSSGTAVVRVRDDVTRVATPGDPDYLEASLAFTVAPSGTPAAFTSITAVQQQGARPWVSLIGSRAQVPDEVAVYRNGVLIARVSGATAFVGGTFSFTDYTMPMNTEATYSVRAVVNGSFSNAVQAYITPRCSGIWLVDPDTGLDAVLWGDDDQDQQQPELAVEHVPANGGAVVRRRLSRFPRQGSISGLLADVDEELAADSEAVLRAWVEQDAGHVYRLVLGNQNDPVILGNVVFSETALNGDERFLNVSADWWWQG